MRVGPLVPSVAACVVFWVAGCSMGVQRSPPRQDPIVESSAVRPTLTPRAHARAVPTVTPPAEMASSTARSVPPRRGTSSTRHLEPDSTPTEGGGDSRQSVNGRPGSTPARDGCDRSRVTIIVQRFLEAFNRGDRESLAGFLESDRFSGFAVGGIRAVEYASDIDPVDPQDVLCYAANRHPNGERLRLIRLQMGQEPVRAHPPPPIIWIGVPIT